MKFLRGAFAAILWSCAGLALADVPDYVTIPPTISGAPNPTYGGTGCPAGTATAVVSPDRQAFTMVFDQYVAEAGPGIPFAESRKNCQIVVNFDFPQGWSFSIFRADYRGFYQLDPGTMGLQSALYYFQGQRQQATVRTPINGPATGDYLIGDTLGLETVVWSPCGARRALNINSSLFVRSSGRGHALMTTDSVDGNVETKFLIQWRRC